MRMKTNNGRAEYIVFGPYTHQEDYEGFSKYDDAVRYAIALSKHIPFQVEIHLAQSDAETRRVAVCQSGTLLQVVQQELFHVEDRHERQILLDMGKSLWLTLQALAKDIRSYQHRLTPLTEAEQGDFTTKKKCMDAILAHLESELSPQAMAAARWKYIDCTMYKNREAELPQHLEHYSRSTVRKYYGAAFVETAEIMLKEHWTANAEMIYRLVNESASNKKSSKDESTKTAGTSKMVTEATATVREIKLAR